MKKILSTFVGFYLVFIPLVVSADISDVVLDPDQGEDLGYVSTATYQVDESGSACGGTADYFADGIKLDGTITTFWQSGNLDPVDDQISFGRPIFFVNDNYVERNFLSSGGELSVTRYYLTGFPAEEEDIPDTACDSVEIGSWNLTPSSFSRTPVGDLYVDGNTTLSMTHGTEGTIDYDYLYFRIGQDSYCTETQDVDGDESYTGNFSGVPDVLGSFGYWSAELTNDASEAGDCGDVRDGLSSDGATFEFPFNIVEGDYPIASTTLEATSTPDQTQQNFANAIGLFVAAVFLALFIFKKSS